MGNPRRDAFEYGVLITLTSGMAAAYAFLIAYSNLKEADGSRKKLPRVDLDAKVDLAEAWEEMKSVSKDIMWGQQQQQPQPPSAGAGSNSSQKPDEKGPAKK